MAITGQAGRIAPLDLKDTFRRVLNILPEGFPLFFLVPNVPSLKFGNLVAGLLLEQRLQVQNFYLHVLSFRLFELLILAAAIVDAVARYAP
jgi:hypothetical protein